MSPVASPAVLAVSSPVMTPAASAALRTFGRPALEVFWIGRRGDHFDERCLRAAGPLG
jgi:hypothetical protein